MGRFGIINITVVTVVTAAYNNNHPLQSPPQIQIPTFIDYVERSWYRLSDISVAELTENMVRKLRFC